MKWACCFKGPYLFIFYIPFIHKVESLPLSKVKIFTEHSEIEPVKGKLSSALFSF